MDDLHRALVLKVYFSVVRSGSPLVEQERCLAEALFDHLWNQRLTAIICARGQEGG